MKSSSWAFVTLATGVCAVAVTAGAVGASGGRERLSAPVRPMHACRAALPGEHVVSAERTTVASARSWGYGGPIQHQPLRTAFGAASAQDRAVWCWTRDDVARVTAYAVHDGDAVRAITVDGPVGDTPRGAPRIP